MEISQPTPLSVEQCKDLLKTIAQAMCVKAEDISTKLLSQEDKKDLMTGRLSLEELLAHVAVWKEQGMHDYVKAP